jgi:imidazole glycerol-phosphate synthase subunit HisH
VHSYAPDVVDDVTVGVAEHGRPFSAAVVKANVFATQFHPEKSGEAGLAIYRNIVEAVARS